MRSLTLGLSTLAREKRMPVTFGSAKSGSMTASKAVTRSCRSPIVMSPRPQSLADLQLVVVDDGSPDATCEIVEQLTADLARITFMRRTHKSGLGDAYRAAFQQALDDGYELLVEIDAVALAG